MQKSISSFFDPTNVILIIESIVFLLKLSTSTDVSARIGRCERA